MHTGPPIIFRIIITIIIIYNQKIKLYDTQMSSKTIAHPRNSWPSLDCWRYKLHRAESTQGAIINKKVRRDGIQGSRPSSFLRPVSFCVRTEKEQVFWTRKKKTNQPKKKTHQWRSKCLKRMLVFSWGTESLYICNNNHLISVHIFNTAPELFLISIK